MYTLRMIISIVADTGTFVNRSETSKDAIVPDFLFSLRRLRNSYVDLTLNFHGR